MRVSPWLLSLSAALTALLAPFGARADVPQLAWDKPIHCMQNPKGEHVRVQCEGEGNHVNPQGSPLGVASSLRGPLAPAKCLVAPMVTMDGAPLDRLADCQSSGEERADYDKLVASGATLTAAMAEVQPGYARSERGRAYQVTFDLLDRIFIGVGWAPTLQTNSNLPPGFPLGRARIETGLSASVVSPHNRARHDIRALEGSVSFQDFEVEGQLFTYDYQHLHRRPSLFVSSFIGAPRLHEISMPLGWGMRLLGVHDRAPTEREALDVEIGELHAAFDPWQSPDLYSHLRIEAGADIGQHWEDRAALPRDGLSSGHVYAGFTSAIRARLALGETGHHYVTLDATYMRPTIIDGPYKFAGFNRLRGEAAYEGIFLAINDQPLSLRLAASGGREEDPATGNHAVDLRFNVGLRFSFWAPARVIVPLPDLEDP